MSSAVVAVAVEDGDQPLLETFEAPEVVQRSITLFSRVQRRLRVIVKHPSYDLLILLMTGFCAVGVAFEAAVGYKFIKDFAHIGKDVHNGNLIVLAMLLVMSILEIIGLGIEWYKPKHVVQLGVILALIYMESIQCWEEQLCTIGGLAVFLLIPYRVNTFGWYATIIDDVRQNPAQYREKARQAVEHPVTHVAVVGLVLADVSLILIEILIEGGYIASGSSHDHTLALYSLARIRLTIYSIFAVEICLEIWVAGRAFFSKIENVVDALTVFLCLAFEFYFSKAQNEYVQLLMLLRLWRMVRIGWAIVEMQRHVERLEDHDERYVEEAATEAQKQVETMMHNVGEATGGMSDQVLNTVSGITGLEGYDQDAIEELHLEFRTLCYIVIFGIIMVTVVSFFVLYYSSKWANDALMAEGGGGT